MRQSPPVRQKRIVDTIDERIQGVAEDTSSAPRLASSSAASFPGRNVCAGAHCSLIEGEVREDRSPREIEIKGKTEENTGW